MERYGTSRQVPLPVASQAIRNRGSNHGGSQATYSVANSMGLYNPCIMSSSKLVYNQQNPSGHNLPCDLLRSQHAPRYSQVLFAFQERAL